MRPALGVFLFSFFLVCAWVFLPGIQHLARVGTGAALEWSLRDPQRVVNAVLPGWLGVTPDNPVEKMAGLLGRVARVELGNPRQLLGSQVSMPMPRPRPSAPRPPVPVLAPPVVEAVGGGGLESVPEQPGRIEVGIYHTHTGETYPLTDGVERFDGRPGAVVEVGRVLKRALEERYGIGVVHFEKVHDVPYSRSYLESEKTVRRMVEEYPDLKLLLDIHRDSLKHRSYALTEIGEQDVATFLLVAGSDARQPFPNWRQNYSLARAIAAKAQELYPGLCVGVIVKEGRYNQFLHPGALLVEVGGVANHTAEALRTAELLADILAAVLRDETADEPPR